MYSMNIYNNSNYYKINKISSNKLYKQIYSTINIEPERTIRIHDLKIKLDLRVYDFMKNIRFEASIFREAYINQRKKYKLLKAYIDLNNEIIDDATYDSIEERCMITINDFDENISLKAIYTFLKHHDSYVDEYEEMELSEILGISYIQVGKILKDRRTINGKKVSQITCK
jgi:hypothetical protein